MGLLEDRCQFELVGGNLVMTCLAGNAQLQSLYLQLTHKGGYPLRDGTEVMVIHLLVLCRIVTHQRATRQQQVGTGSIEALVHEEILLFPAKVRRHFFYRRVEIVAHVRRSHVDGMEGTQQWSLVVECLTAIRYEDGGNTQCVVDDKDRRRGVPCRIATSFERRADSTAGERRRIRFLLDKQLAGKVFHHASFTIVHDK